MSENIEDKIKEVLDKIRPFLQNDGGDIQYVDYKDGIVYVSVLGACIDCVGLDDTIKDGVEMILMEEVEGVIGVEVVRSTPTNQLDE
jgi:Fe-S cluster biogenesis protein NfuA